MGSRRHWALAGVATTLLVASLAAVPAVDAAPAPLRGAVRPCSNGLVALTFDDGPSRSVTPDLLELLDSRHVPATFFVVGSRVAAAPRIVRRMDALGFTVANHTYGHERLTRLSAAAITSTLRRTRRAVTRSGAVMSNLMRPPYGLIDGRVRAVVRDLGLTPVLWTIDPQDWKGFGSATIADRVIGGLRSDATNIVLLHDGIANSPSTLRAVPDIIRRARSRGFCFAELGRDGLPAPPVPAARVTNAAVKEATGHQTRLRFTVRLDRPTSRRTSLWVATEDRSAGAGHDYASVARRLRFPVGTTRRTVEVRVFGDAHDERRERLVLQTSQPRGLRLLDAAGSGTIRDDDPPPGITLGDAAAVEPAVGTAWISVPLELTAPSGRWIAVSVETRSGSAGEGDFVAVATDLALAPGEVSGSVAIEVLADALIEGAEQFSLVVTAKRHAAIVDGEATVTIDEPAEIREAFANRQFWLWTAGPGAF